MKILFLGNYLPRKYEKVFQTLSAAGNQYQNNMVDALKKENTVYSITYSGLSEVKIEIEEREKLKHEGIEIYLPKVDGYFHFFDYRNRIKTLAKSTDCIITYNVIYLWFWLRRLANNKNCRLILVLADYTPPYEERSWRKFYSWLMGKQFAKYDKVVLLSEKSKIYVKDENKCVTINGCIDWNLFKDIRIKKKNEWCIIAYTGFISKVTGIELLIKAFEMVKNKNCKLIISGQIDNNEKANLIKICENNPLIEYWGYVDKEKYISLLQNADILVNPRDMSYQQNQYNFPSKILEYLAAGRIVVSTRFNGYQNYENNIVFCESTSESLAEHLNRCIDTKNEIYRRVYESNREFIQQFTWDKQINRFL